MLELKYLWSIVNLEKAKRLSEASDRTAMSLYEGSSEGTAYCSGTH